MSTVGLAATTSIAGIFGMNLVSGVEEAPPRLDLERAVRRACDAG